MATLTVTNTHCHLSLDTPPRLVKTLDEATAYVVAGHEHSPSYRMKHWDGKQHLVKGQRGKGWNFPVGIINEVLPLINEYGVSVLDRRRAPAARFDFEWTGHEPRGYQHEAIEAALADRGLATGRGLLNLPIRSGKTLISGKLIQMTGLRTLFTVPSDLLLYQTLAAFRASLDPPRVGQVGDGTWEPDIVTVATVQTLLARPAAASVLLASADMFFVDEAHHLEGEAWREPAIECDAPYKLGLSATIYARPEVENERAAIWMRAATGPILFRVSMARLMDEGHLMRPIILIYPITKPANVMDDRWRSGRCYTEGIVRNGYRNSAIVDLAIECASLGLRVLVDTGRVEQMNALAAMIRARKHNVATMYGKTPGPARQQTLKRWQRSDVNIVVGTILGEGVDIPELEVVINAEGWKATKSVIQRMRNLTPDPGKKGALFIDFDDRTNTYLTEHSAERVKTYRGTRGFDVRVMDKPVDDRFRLPADLPFR